MGKDRTGVVFALILSLAGVSREVIVAEYSLSESALKQHLPQMSKLVQKSMPHGVDKSDVEIMAQQVIKSSSDFMLLTLQMIDDEFGGVTEYLKSQCGLTEDDICEIQNLLLENSI
ncbi:protein-tyrosine phosphatase-like protein [Penicillium malachiteum]|uniref:protein-tyrosine phosphatase-like protein n=1 Tax=Penicillium malachiteum TaxID=1324776 RepID=UPI0025470B9F|nr:protein-tyrosine phosphatase-like protein [Penicillium malachiteum]KAJ5726037.1 protein-tyrosine phosphatase-like protein [Penicillium malachiteum]